MVLVPERQIWTWPKECGRNALREVVDLSVLELNTCWRGVFGQMEYLSVQEVWIRSL